MGVRITEIGKVGLSVSSLISKGFISSSVKLNKNTYVSHNVDVYKFSEITEISNMQH